MRYPSLNLEGLATLLLDMESCTGFGTRQRARGLRGNSDLGSRRQLCPGSRNFQMPYKLANLKLRDTIGGEDFSVCDLAKSVCDLAEPLIQYPS